MAAASVSFAGVVGRMPRTNRISFAYSLPNPATLRWSSSATWTGRVVGGEPPRGLRGSQSLAERVGTEVADELLLVAGRDHLDVGEVEADGLPLGGADDRARLERGLAPALRRPVDVPLALHLEVGVQRVVADAVQQVLAARDDLVHGRAAQVDRRRLRHAQLEAGDLGARERLVEPLRRAEDGVALRHGARRPRRASDSLSLSSARASSPRREREAARRLDEAGIPQRPPDGACRRRTRR